MRHVPIHIRNLIGAPDQWVQKLIDGANTALAQVGMAVDVVSNQKVDADFFQTLAIGCDGNQQGALTQAQDKLFDIRDSPQDIVFYIVRQTTPHVAGCARHPANRPGAILVFPSDEYAGFNDKDQWLLVHELGHILHLDHRGDSDLLMFTSMAWTLDPPELLRDEGTLMAAAADNGPGTGGQPAAHGDGVHHSDNLGNALLTIETGYLNEVPRLSANIEKFARDLERLVQDKSVFIASRAAYLSTLVNSALLEKVRQLALQDASSDVRIALAGGLRHLTLELARQYFEQLVEDKDPLVASSAMKFWSTRIDRSELRTQLLDHLRNGSLDAARSTFMKHLRDLPDANRR